MDPRPLHQFETRSGSSEKWSVRSPQHGHFRQRELGYKTPCGMPLADRMVDEPDTLQMDKVTDEHKHPHP